MKKKKENEEDNHNEKKSTIIKTKGFTGSNGWFNRFKQRYELYSKKLVGEAGSSMASNYQEQINIIASQISEFHPDNVYNMDETGIFYKMLPNFSYCFYILNSLYYFDLVDLT